MLEKSLFRNVLSSYTLKALLGDSCYWVTLLTVRGT